MKLFDKWCSSGLSFGRIDCGWTIEGGELASSCEMNEEFREEFIEGIEVMCWWPLWWSGLKISCFRFSSLVSLDTFLLRKSFWWCGWFLCWEESMIEEQEVLFCTFCCCWCCCWLGKYCLLPCKSFKLSNLFWTLINNCSGMFELMSWIQSTLVSNSEAISVLTPFKLGIKRLSSLQLNLIRSLLIFSLTQWIFRLNSFLFGVGIMPSWLFELEL